MQKIRWIILIMLALTVCDLQAHSPDISTTILSKQKSGRWILQMKSSLTAYEYMVESKYGPSSFATPQEFMELVLETVTENVTLISNSSKPAQLINGLVKLGHETNVIFELKGMAPSVHRLDIINSSFSSNSYNQNAFIIFKDSLQKKQFILNKDNQYQLSLKLENKLIEEIEPATKSSGSKSKKNKILLSVFLIGLILMAYYGIKIYF